MAADFVGIRKAIAANLQNALGKTIQVSPVMLASPTPPAAHVIPGPIEYHGALSDGLETVEMTVQVFVSRTTDIGAQTTLDEYIASDGPSSVKAAIESDSRLGGKCADLIVTSSSGYRVYKSPDGSGEVIGAEWLVKVYV
ncbi:MAG TPA: hypothetical protein VH063_18945 [Gaiellaceae bacterium]|jgi:hypothetical protein|nr:hypothetical protein [Gaiellaceae bacterium]